ncbi:MULTISPECIES: MBL fold metallo-hydrolase [unclassified Mesorhizobium]|uniref:MBL fold metallo-hydrolase n=1 Tax=unclassified Mesorhizobium TaxID=325217 RepID=UPI001CCF3073|nr:MULTISPECIES: MBL fold metallo-hydrolase [unclassified Mesorhizobium]MBZ9740092.1 MBL fold metallo-hydrolase [Mesorhizobium sp. CO1-1-4]MBZ9803241.1 MBL fold metallo-hydrolase [Mesorhizobium sp. ES1-6]MBZ9995721.1 MBL fold metallo-hydrolase [Mesorhizobium sp. BH1-1-4]
MPGTGPGGPSRAAGWFSSEDLGGGITRLWEPHVHSFFRSNIFHLRGRDVDLVIDAGMGLVPLKPLLNLSRGKPALAVATHIHVDHVGALSEFETRAGHRAEAAFFADMADEHTLAHLFRAQPEAVGRSPGVTWSPLRFRIKPAPLSRILDEGDRIETGDRSLRILHLPGHSPGSIGLLDEENGDFFAGDAIYRGRLIDDLPGSDVQSYRNTMRRLLQIEFSRAYCGHGEAIDQEELRSIARAYLDGTS